MTATGIHKAFRPVVQAISRWWCSAVWKRGRAIYPERLLDLELRQQDPQRRQPAELPSSGRQNFDLVINLRTVEQIGTDNSAKRAGESGRGDQTGTPNRRTRTR